MEKTPELEARSARVLPWLVAVAFFMQMLDSTILNTALPAMARSLKTDPLQMQSAVIAYMLTAALLVPVSGWLADRFGTRRVFVLSLFLFTAGSLCCALSPNLSALVAARVLQGVGGALMVPVGRLSVLRAFPKEQIVQVLSFITIPGLIGPLMGPVTGGFLVQYASWHWIFLINIPVGLVGGVLSLLYMPESRAEKPLRFDGAGFVFFSASMICILLAMEGLGELELPKVQATLLCVAGLCLMVVYWLRAARIDYPLFAARLFKNRCFAVGIFGNFFARLSSGAMPFLMPLFLQVGIGFSPFKAGMTMIPGAAAGMIGKKLINELVRRFGFRTFLTVNTVLLGGIITLFSRVDAHTPYPLLLCLLGIFGVVNSMQFTAMNSVTLIDLSVEETASGNGLLSVVMMLSASCGVAMAAALLDGFSQGAGAPAQGMHQLQIFTQTFFWVGVIGALSAAVFSRTPRDAGAAARLPDPRDMRHVE